MLTVIVRRFVYRIKNVVLELYICLVRLFLECSMQIWSSCLIIQVLSIETIQQSSTRQILGMVAVSLVGMDQLCMYQDQFIRARGTGLNGLKARILFRLPVGSGMRITVSAHSVICLDKGTSLHLVGGKAANSPSQKAVIEYIKKYIDRFMDSNVIKVYGK